MKDISLLVDYKGHFGTKHGAIPYRSGLDREKLARHFQDCGWRARFLNFCDVDFRSADYKDRCFLYTSAEDHELHYRSFIEDIVLGLEISGARMVPAFKFLRAHHNKVFMEILRERILQDEARGLISRFFGTREELAARAGDVELPSVVKPASGSMSVGVRLCKSPEDLARAASSVSSSRHWPSDAWDLGRMWKRKGYVRESLHRRKFVVQPFLPGLANDWKILIYGKKYYVLMRRTRQDDFRASGSGRFEFIKEIPAGLLDFASSVFSQLDVPHLSMDVGVAGNRFHLFEFQAVHFGTTTIEESPYHFSRSGQEWTRVDGPSEVEEEFVRSVVDYLSTKEREPESGGGAA
jgi:glutathione synthase/RimK-type ligase-like ATP-grasp enzyme